MILNRIRVWARRSSQATTPIESLQAKPAPSAGLRFLTVLGLTGLAVYVLACASFSPDDSMVAFPTVDMKAGQTGVAVWHRQTGRTEQVFSMARVGDPARGNSEARLLRTQWVDNQRLVIAWPGTGANEHDGLSLLTLPVVRRGPTLWRAVDGIDEMDQKLLDALALAGPKLLVAAESNLVVRLDLNTGQVESHACRGRALALYPAGNDNFVFYLAQDAARPGMVEVGRLEAASFAQTPVAQVEAGEFEKNTRVAFSEDGKQIAWVSEKGGTTGVRLVRAGQAVRALPLSARVEVTSLGNLCFSRKQDLLYASFAGRNKGDARLSLGVLEIPLDGRPTQHTFVLEGTDNMETEPAVYFQINLSHDGQTLAASSTYLLGDKDKPMIKLSDYGLFLIDVSKWPHKVTRVPPPAM